MSNQSKFLSPDLTGRVLQHLPLKDQIIVRRVNKDFKHVVENSVWPNRRCFDCKDLIKVPRDVIEDVISHMKNLRIFKYDEYDFEFGKMTFEVDELPALLAKNCHSIRNILNEWSSGYDITIDYAKHLCQLGIDISKLDLQFKIYGSNFDLGGLPIELISKIIWETEWLSRPKEVPDDFIDKIIGTRYNKNHSYFPNVKSMILDFNEPVKLEFTYPEYFQQVTSLKIEGWCLLDKINKFSMLKELYDDRDFDCEKPWKKEPSNQERRRNSNLATFLVSDKGRFLDILVIKCTHKRCVEELILQLAYVKRPIKWKTLSIGLKEKTTLSYNKSTGFTFKYEWPYEPLPMLSGILSQVKSPSKITIETPENFDFSKPSLRLENLNSWMEFMDKISSSRRDLQFTIKLWVERFDGSKKIEGDNWTITYNSSLYDETSDAAIEEEEMDGDNELDDYNEDSDEDMNKLNNQPWMAYDDESDDDEDL